MDDPPPVTTEPRLTSAPGRGLVAGEPSLGSMVVERIRSVLQAEDLLLVGWLLVLAPALASAAGGDPPFQLAGDRPPIVGLLYLVACAGAIACFLTRSRGEPVVAMSSDLSLRAWARFPMSAAAGMIALEGGASLGIDAGDAVLGIAFLAAIVGLVVPGRLPEVAASTRRAFVLPFVLVGSGIFESLMADVWDGTSFADLLPAIQEQEGGGFAIFILTMLGAASLMFYVLFVFAPRIVAESNGATRIWVLRFALFFASVVLGASWLRAIA